MIGIFDSGLGGLTALKEAIRLMPDADFVYFGDTGRVPYGTRSPDTIRKYASQAVRFLISEGVDGILAACGTVSSVAIDHLKQNFNMPIVGVVEPTAAAAAEATKNGKIAVIGTNATINSNSFGKRLSNIDPNFKVLSIPCPMFVPLVENGFISADDEVARLIAERYLAPVRDFGADTIILGCTHFPIISKTIEKVLPDTVQINSGSSAAGELARDYKKGGRGTVRYYVSDSPDGFDRLAEIFMGHAASVGAQKINIENY